MSIEILKEKDFDDFISFIDNNWKKNHIFTKDRNLFEWQYRGQKNFNFIISKNNNKIDGMLGFIPIKHYDNNLSEKVYWLTLWKVIENSNINGFDLYIFFKKFTNFDTLIVLGISDIAYKFYKILRFKTGIMNHYYIQNEKISDFCIGKFKTSSKDNKKNTQNNFKIKKIVNINELKTIVDLYYPFKSINYIINRYLNHPTYKYYLYGVYDNKKLKTVFITRKVYVGNNSCLRIMDIYGKIDKLGNINEQFQNLLQDEQSEYIDLYNYGIDENKLKEIGFKKRENDDIIIPNYFEPYERKNVEIKYAFKSSKENIVIFKGDSDQDRPNI